MLPDISRWKDHELDAFRLISLRRRDKAQQELDAVDREIGRRKAQSSRITPLEGEGNAP